MKTNSTESREWKDVGDDELANIVNESTDRGVRRMAKAELRKRRRKNKITYQSPEEMKGDQAEIVAIRLSVADWFGVIFRALPAIIIAVIIIHFIILMINMAMLNLVIGEVERDIINLDPFKNIHH